MTDPAPPPPGVVFAEGERLFRILAQHSSDVIAVFDLDSRPLYVSPSVLQLRGYTAEECMAQTTEQRLTPRSQEVVRKAMAEVLAIEAAGQTPLNSFRRLEARAARARTARRSGWSRPSRGSATTRGGRSRC